MKTRKYILLLTSLVIIFTLTACTGGKVAVDRAGEQDYPQGQIYLYGEVHAVEKILEKELEIWHGYYHNENMRHLFIEYPYYTGELLNLWMEEENDEILEGIYKDWWGTASQVPAVKEFLRTIKRDCPETIFHGTDVGHQYGNTGERFLKYLEDNNLKDTESYLLTQEAIEQGKIYYKNRDYGYRENKMVENFIREFDKLEGESIMGIYGGAHTDFEAMEYTSGSVPSMAKQLKEYYGDNIHSEDLSGLAKLTDPLRIDTITVGGKDYQAHFFGAQDLTGYKGYEKREFWRLENAYEDFKEKSKTGGVLPYSNYPMDIGQGEVFIIDYTKTGGKVERVYCRSDGYIWNGLPSTEEFIVEE